MKVMLLFLPGFIKQPLPEYLYPLGIGYLAASLKDSHDIDAHYFYNEKRARKEIPEKFASFKPDIVTLTCNTYNRGFVRKTIRQLRDIDGSVKIIVGGVHASFCYEQILRRYGADVVVIGEGELVMQELCTAMERNAPLSSVNGIAFMENNGVVCNPPQNPIADLDDLPMPDHSYARSLMERSGMGLVITSRGCPLKCRFCATSSFWGQSVRTNTVPRVVDEMEMLISRYNVNKIFFHDDTFNLGISRVKALCKEIMDRGIKVEWACQCRVTPVSEEMIAAMVEAGCRHLAWGVESGSEEILSQIDKGTTLAQIRNAFELSARFSDVLATCALVMVGNPGESEKTIQETLDFLNTLPMTDPPYTSILRIYPGTLLYESIKANGYMREEDWYRYDTVPFYTLENSLRTQVRWTEMIVRSGNITPFAPQKRFFHSAQETAALKIDTKLNAAIKRLVGIVTRPEMFMHRVRMSLPAGRIRF
jgi:radical SAM superfamily enzyme YgiQ (UPF0313 family)